LNLTFLFTLVKEIKSVIFSYLIVQIKISEDDSLTEKAISNLEKCRSIYPCFSIDIVNTVSNFKNIRKDDTK